MSRFVSLVALLAILVVIGLVSFKVLFSFLLPMFLAAVLVVLFRPMHRWMVVRLRGRTRMAAALTTLAILTIVLLPAGLVFARAGYEAMSMVSSLDRDDLSRNLEGLRARLGLNLPPADVRQRLEHVRITLESWRQSAQAGTRAERDENLSQTVDKLEEWLDFVAASATVTQHPNRPEVERWLETLRDRLAALRGFRADAPEFQVALRDATSAFHRFEQQLLGGPVTARLKQLANPGPEDAEQFGQEFATWLGPLALRTPQVLGSVLIKFIIGLAVMIVSLYFFLADGPAITTALMRLSPLDDRYEEQLLNEFVKLSRAVVLSTLLSALVQGTLAGLGYYFAGIPSVFLMTVLTMVFAMIPFVGAAAGWLSCSLWLAFYAGHPAAGIGLAIWGLLIVSLADNVVKPMVLHGQSNLHPLLALLSVLGGVTALGPIGIFVGPMAVAFLQALLVMLQTELQSLSGGATAPGSTAVEVSAAAQSTSGPPPKTR